MNKPEIVLSINRFGEFDIEPSQFCGAQCGSNEMVHYSYKVRIEATNKKLIEPEMFVLDNEHVTAYFNKKYVEEKCTVRSCEIVAQDAIEYFLNLFVGDDAPHKDIDVRSIKVWVRGSEVSFITGEWVKQ